jgi:hypothetical protein
MSDEPFPGYEPFQQSYLPELPPYTLRDFPRFYAGGGSTGSDNILSLLRQYDPEATYNSNWGAGEGVSTQDFGFYNYRPDLFPTTQYGALGLFAGAGDTDDLIDPNLRYEDPNYGWITPSTNVKNAGLSWIDIVGPALTLGFAGIGSGLIAGGIGSLGAGAGDIASLGGTFGAGADAAATAAAIGGGAGAAAGGAGAAGGESYLSGLLDAGLTGSGAAPATPFITQEGLLAPVTAFAPGAVTSASGTAALFGPTTNMLGGSAAGAGLLDIAKKVAGSLGDASKIAGLLGSGGGGGLSLGLGGGGRGFGGTPGAIPGKDDETRALLEEARRRRGLSQYYQIPLMAGAQGAQNG